MRWFIQDDVLHVVFDSQNIPQELDDLGTLYEGKIKGRIGVNLPMYVLRENDPYHPFSQLDAQYIICYPSWGNQIKEHELLHAKYFIDPVYRQKIDRLWRRQSGSYQEKVYRRMKAYGYPEDVWIDEWQAYLFTDDLDI